MDSGDDDSSSEAPSSVGSCPPSGNTHVHHREVYNLRTADGQQKVLAICQYILSLTDIGREGAYQLVFAHKGLAAACEQAVAHFTANMPLNGAGGPLFACTLTPDSVKSQWQKHMAAARSYVTSGGAGVTVCVVPCWPDANGC